MAAGETQWKPAALNETFSLEDQLHTLEKSRAAVLLRNETTLRLDQNTVVKYSSGQSEAHLLELFSGRALFMARFSQPLTIGTPYMNASNGGTEYVILDAHIHVSH